VSTLAELARSRAPWGIRSTRVVGVATVRPATVVIEGGRIVAVVEGAAPACPVVDLGERVVGPGLVDSHVHVNEPGRTDWEGFATATRAAAAGGVTTIVDMPLNCIPVTTTRAALEEKVRATRGQLAVDVGFWGGVVPGNAGELAELAAAGALGCKAFLVHSGIDEFPNATEADLRAAMPALRAAGLPLLAHAELDLGGPAPAADYGSYLASRPPEWEEAAIALLIRLARQTGCAVHVVHLSAASSLPLIARAKEEGLPLSVETCPHYLCLDAASVPEGATEWKCAPPIREPANREALWEGLRAGVIDLVVTDHSPCTPALKARERGDFAAAWGGISSLQLGLPAVWTEARRRGHALGELFDWMSARPAALAGLTPRKGRIAPGADADLVVFDPEAEVTVEAAGLHFRHKLSPYLGRKLRGRIEATLLRGQLIYDAGQHRAGAVGQPLLGRETHA
jgi:allantoinase